MKEIGKHICPVCGYPKLAEAPYDKYGYPSYVICSCCGFEFGFDDSSNKMIFTDYREKWINRGFPFFVVNKKPKNWGKKTMLQQLMNADKVDYKPRVF